ncbi:unnamed protein product [Oikopleura dioica]|uniref:AP complex subunit sigma n=1 Tax=Oikopleura dioica TaxID=34765 RepID=E4Z5E6_OIKDI|nr:unnamed protein product [Oikopleura dioica]
MYRSVILFSRHGRLRLSKWFLSVPEKERNKTNHEVIQIALNRNGAYSNIFHHKGVKYIYKRYASLFFCLGIDEDENELIALALIHRMVEALDRYFGNVCELDVIFNFERVHMVMDEILLGGEIQETSLREVKLHVQNADTEMENEINGDVEAVINLQQFRRQIRRV